MKLTFNKIVKNKYLLYFISLIAFIDILGYLLKYDIGAVLFFYLIGLITYRYTKNMTIILTTSLICTTILDLVKKTHFKEGFKEGHKPDKPNKHNKPKKPNNGKKSKKKR